MAYKFNPFTQKLDIVNGIGSFIPGGTPNSVLFIDSSGNLAQDNPDFIYNATLNVLTVGNIALSIASSQSVFYANSSGYFAQSSYMKFDENNNTLTLAGGTSDYKRLILKSSLSGTDNLIEWGDSSTEIWGSFGGSSGARGFINLYGPVGQSSGSGFQLSSAAGTYTSTIQLDAFASFVFRNVSTLGAIYLDYGLIGGLFIRNNSTAVVSIEGFGSGKLVEIISDSTTKKTLVVTMKASQTANPFLIQTSGSSPVCIIDTLGKVSAGTGAQPTAYLHAAPSTTSASSFRAESGTAPTSPNEGDFWNDSTQKSIIGFIDGVNQAISGVLFTQTADKSVSNTTTETTIIGTGLGTLTLPANFFVPGKTIRITMSGVYSTVAVTGDTVTIKIKYGSTVLASKATTALVTGGTNLFWWSEVLITCRSTGSSGTVQVSGGVIYQIAGSATVEDELNNSAGTTTLNTTTSNLLDLTVTHSAANASNTVKSLVGAFEVLN